MVKKKTVLLISHKCSKCGNEEEEPFDLTLPENLVILQATKGVRVKGESEKKVKPKWVKGPVKKI